MGPFRRQEPQLAAGRRVVVRTPAGHVLVTRVLELDGTCLRLDDVTEVLVGTSITVLGDHADGPWAASAIVTAGPPLSIALRELPRTLPERRAVPRLTEGPRLTATVLRGARVGAGIAVGGPLVDLSPHGVAFAPSAPLASGDRVAVSLRVDGGPTGLPIEATVLRAERRVGGTLVVACRFADPQHALLAALSGGQASATG